VCGGMLGATAGIAPARLATASDGQRPHFRWNCSPRNFEGGGDLAGWQADHNTFSSAQARFLLNHPVM